MQHQKPKKSPTDPKLLSRAKSMRREPSIAENKLWTALRAGRLNEQKWRRQCAMAGYILDFFCSEVGLAVELDGESHDTSSAYDDGRSAALAKAGIRTVRFRNEDVLFHIDSVLRTINLEYNESKASCGRRRPLP